jgi:two-component sensor histidine kinase/integral membrane sensor domain MASE1
LIRRLASTASALRQLGLYRFSLRHVVLVALLNVSSGWLCLQLAPSPGYISAVFPPAGIALAAMLLWGGGVWPGVFLGSFCLNILVGLAAPGGIESQDVELAGLVAAGSSLQALAGLLLVQRYVPDAPLLRDARRVVAMLLLGALACLIASAVGCASLVLMGKLNNGAWPISVWTWWVGDSIGVILCTPQFLVLSQLNRQNRRALLLTVIAPSLTMLALVVMLFVQASAWERQRIEAAFRAQARPLVENLQLDLGSYQSAVDSVQRFFENSSAVSPAAFTNFTRELRAKYPGIVAIVFVPEVTGSARAAFEQKARALGFPGYAIRQKAADGRMQIEAQEPVYYPVFYIEPQGRYDFVEGYVFASSPPRLLALSRARDNDVTAASSRVTLFGSNHDGVLIMSPIYAGGGTVGSGEFGGVIVGVLDLGALINSATPGAITENIVLNLDDVTEPGHPERLYHGSGSGSSRRGLTQRQTLHLGDRRWQLTVAASEVFINSQSTFVSWLVLAAGLLFTGVLQMLLLAMSGYARNIEEEVQARTHELAASKLSLGAALKEQETLLKEVYHRVKNNLQVIYSLLNLEGYGLQEGPARAALQNTAARVRAMALVHEKLYRSGSLASISLADYLKDLLAQIKSANADSSRRISVDSTIAEVQIGLDFAIPLGLLVNELVSNSLKHGYPQGGDGRISVRIMEDDDNRLLLTVSDDGAGMPPDFTIERSASMGLRLASSLARQLGGELVIKPGPGAAFSVRMQLS